MSKMTPGISLRFPWYSQVYTVKEFSVGPIVLDSRVSECLLDTLTLKKYLSGHTHFFCEEFLTMSISSI